MCSLLHRSTCLLHLNESAHDKCFLVMLQQNSTDCVQNHCFQRSVGCIPLIQLQQAMFNTIRLSPCVGTESLCGRCTCSLHDQGYRTVPYRTCCTVAQDALSALTSPTTKLAATYDAPVPVKLRKAQRVYTSSQLVTVAPGQGGAIKSLHISMQSRHLSINNIVSVLVGVLHT